jgi:hypothetical protein
MTSKMTLRAFKPFSRMHIDWQLLKEKEPMKESKLG